MQGVKSVKESSLEGVRYVFIQPPSLEVLEERLRARGTETEEAIEKVRGSSLNISHPQMFWNLSTSYANIINIWILLLP